MSALEAMSVDELRDLYLSLRGPTRGRTPGNSKKALIESIMRFEARGATPGQPAAPKGGAKVKVEEQAPAALKPSGASSAARATKVTVPGSGPYRYVIVKNGQIAVDAGPMPTARAAGIAAHTLLRTRAQAYTNPISQKPAFELIQATKTGLEKHGTVVDGYTMEGTSDEWEAYVYLPNDAGIAYAGSRGFERLRPSGKAGESLSLANLPDSFAARVAANRGRRMARRPGRNRR
jgi:hypothetical protein